MSSSGAKPSSSDAKFREHTHGRQNREYTSEQKAAVERIKRCKATAYYEILAVEKTSAEGQIKKAYHKLSLATHPDKNGAPGADEAFKLVSKAFQVLSDPQKRQIFDQTGSDPDSRGRPGGGGGDGGGGHAASPFGFAGASAAGPEISPEDLFNMFFGGGGGGGGMGGGVFGNGGGIFDDGRGFAFGGPGIRVHQFGGGPRMRRRTANTTNAGGATAEEPTSLTRIFWQLLPLLIFFLIPMLGGLFGGDDSGGLRGPQFAMDARAPYTQQRVTPTHKIPFFVNPADVEGLGMRDTTRLGQRAEAAIVNSWTAGCNREQLTKSEKIQAAQGFFFTDQEKVREARAMPMPNCRKLDKLDIPRRRNY